jgi:Probable cobalt transporter subunit (CbtB)
MSVINKQIAIENNNVPKVAVGALLGILIFGMFVVGYDQGQIAEALLGSVGIHPTHTQLMLLHEFNHDLRHSAGFPCH